MAQKRRKFTRVEISARRRAALREIASALGFENWSKLETEIKRAYERGDAISLTIGSRSVLITSKMDAGVMTRSQVSLPS